MNNFDRDDKLEIALKIMAVIPDDTCISESLTILAKCMIVLTVASEKENESSNAEIIKSLGRLKVAFTNIVNSKIAELAESQEEHE